MSNRWIKVHFYSLYGPIYSPLLGKDVCALATFRRQDAQAKEGSVLSGLNFTVKPASEINHQKRYPSLICCRQPQSVSSPVRSELSSGQGECRPVSTNSLAFVDGTAVRHLRPGVPGKVKPGDKMDGHPWLPFSA